MRLRDGSLVLDRRLGMIVHLDPRNARYPVRARLDAEDRTVPRSHSWRLPDEALNQGSEGSCTGHAVAHELAARPAPVKGIDHAYALGLYYDAQRTDGTPGGAYPGAEPYGEGTSVSAAVKVGVTRGFYSEYRWATGLDDVVLALSWLGPVILGIPWHEGMFRPDSDGYVEPTGEIKGWHAVCARRVNILREDVWIRNSYGPGWGVDGEFRLRWDALAWLLAVRGAVACIPTRTAMRTA